jgi:hypothetical protein
MALSPEDLATYQARLSEAEKALHSFMIGGQPVRVQDQSGESVTYNATNISRLKAYIAELKALIAGDTPNGGPMCLGYA